jgi:hypothetical protein
MFVDSAMVAMILSQRRHCNGKYVGAGSEPKDVNCLIDHDQDHYSYKGEELLCVPVSLLVNFIECACG